MCYGHVNDPDLDQIVLDMILTADAEVNQEKDIKAQRYIVEYAYVAPLYAGKY